MRVSDPPSWCLCWSASARELYAQAKAARNVEGSDRHFRKLMRRDGRSPIIDVPPQTPACKYWEVR
jgi:hypothetical protein